MNLYSMMSGMQGGMCMVAERAAAATGEVTISETRDVPIRALRAFICDVIVHPAYQGRGIGRLLVEATEAHPALQHVEMLCLFTTEKHDFYAHLGWEAHPGHGMILRR